MPSFFEQYFQHVGTLRHEVPVLNQALGEPADLTRMPGWSEMENQPRERVLFNGRPALVATTFGPSGSGKSTFFSMLTGVEVPRSVIRPTTFQSLAVMPESMVSAADSLFPDFRTVELENGEMAPLTLSQADQDLLYVHGNGNGGEGSHTSLVLTDVPDFNSVEKANWNKAERLLARAEVVLFLVYPESYSDNRVIELLLRCCRSKVKLVYIHNKCGDGSRKPADLAEELWNHLVTKTVEQDSRFAEKREDGRTLAEFLKCAPVYYCPHSQAPTLQQVRALSENAPDLHSLLYGMDGSRIVQENLLQIGRRVSASAVELCDKADKRRGELEGRIARMERAVWDCAGFVAGNEFPFGRMLELLIEVIRKSRPKWYRAVSTPVSWVCGKVIKGYASVYKWLPKRDANVLRDRLTPREKLETERLWDGVESLADACRYEVRDDMPLSAADITAAKKSLMNKPIPGPNDDWEGTVRSAAEEWVKEHKTRAQLVASLNELLVLAGGGSIVLDIFVTGGMGQLGVIALAGAGAGTAGIVLKLYEELGMRQVLVDADAAWLSSRKKELRDHVRDNFAAPLVLDRVNERIDRLGASRIGSCREACEYLRRLTPDSSS